MLFIDIRTAFLGYIIVNIVNLFLIGSLYFQLRKNFKESLIIFISFIMSASGNVLLFFRESLIDWIPIIIGNTLIISSTVVLFIGFERFLNKKGMQVQNYILILLFLLSQSYFTFIKPDINIRNLNISIYYLLISPQIGWLMLVRAPKIYRKVTVSVGLIFNFVFVIHAVRVYVIILSPQNEALYFSSNTSEGYFLFLYEFILIILAYSISLMYSKRLIITTINQEKKIAILHTENLRLELDFKNKELSQKELSIASMKEANKNILSELKDNLQGFSKKESSDILKIIQKFKNTTQKAQIWEEFDDRFKEVNSEFYEKLNTSYTNISTNEMRVACLLYQNYSTKEIAEILQRSAKTVENIRGLLRKKMNLQKDENLTLFLQSIK